MESAKYLHSMDIVASICLMTVTLADVARETGVSAATVSRVLRDDPRISEVTKARVKAALDSLGYSGRGWGADMRTMSAAFLVADPIGSVHEDLFFNEVLRGVVEHLEPRGYYALASPSKGRPGPRGGLPPVVRRADGVIAGGVSLQSSLVRVLRDGPVPAVFVGRFLRGRGLNSILPDNEEGGRLATEHLLGLGRRSVAFIGGPPKTNIYHDRLAGFRRAFEEAGLRVDERLIRSTQRTPQGGIDSVLELLDEVASPELMPDAVFAADDWIAVGVLRALRQRGCRVPDDVAVVGYSDIALAPIADPPLTTVHVPKRRLGRISAKLLLDIIEGDIEGPVQIIVSPHLVVRGSTVQLESEATTEGML